MPPDTLPQGIVLALDVRVTLFAIAAALGAGVLFGLAPAWHATDVSLAATMVSRGPHGDRSFGATARGPGNRGSGGRDRAAVRCGPTRADLAVARAGRCRQSRTQRHHDDGGAPDARYPTEARLAAFYRNVERELRRFPGSPARRSVAVCHSTDGTSGKDSPSSATRRLIRPISRRRTTRSQGRGSSRRWGIPILRGRALPRLRYGHRSSRLHRQRGRSCVAMRRAAIH
jgi:hypothetical protein